MAQSEKQSHGVAAEGASPAVTTGAGGPRNGLVFLYLSEVLNAPVRFEDERTPCGRLYDIGASTAALPYPPVVCIEVRGRACGRLVIPWSAVRQFSATETVIGRDTTPVPVAFWARRDVLDDQIVDLSGARVLRVNDVHLIYSDGNLVFAHVEVGILGILRRLRFDRPARFLLRWLFDYSLKESFVTWRHVEVLPTGRTSRGVRVTASPNRLAGIHPAELADIMEQLGVRERQTLLQSLPLATAAETLEEVHPDVQRALISQTEPGKAADILEEMPPEQAAGVLRDLHDPDAEKIMDRMEHEAAAEVKTRLAHGEASAGGVMATNCVEAGPEESVATALARIRSLTRAAEVLSPLFVVDSERRLLGLLSLRELVCADPEASLASLITRHIVSVPPDASLADVAKLFVKYGFRAIPVVGDENVFLGAVQLRSVLAELQPAARL